MPFFVPGHLSNFKVTWADKKPISFRLEHFWAITLIWLHWWLSNNTHSIKEHAWSSLLPDNVICQIPRSQGPNQRFHVFEKDYLAGHSYQITKISLVYWESNFLLGTNWKLVNIGLVTSHFINQLQTKTASRQQATITYTIVLPIYTRPAHGTCVHWLINHDMQHHMTPKTALISH